MASVNAHKRTFQTSWEEEFFFVLPDGANAIPTCLICNKTVSIAKKANISRHYQSMHSGGFSKLYPPSSEKRKEKLRALKAELLHAQTMVKDIPKTANGLTEASLRVTYVLMKHKKAFRDSEIVRECLLEVADSAFQGKERENAIRVMKAIPLSDSNTARKCEEIANHLSESLFHELRNCGKFALALDEATDITDKAQLCLFVRYFDGTSIVEDFLGVQSLPERTRGEDIFSSLKQFFEVNNLSLESIISVTTDGAPAMVGKEKGLVKMLKDIIPNLQSYHCIIHQTALCGRLKGDFSQIMTTVMKLINFIRSKSSLQHRLFRSFTHDVSSEYTELLLHNDVRWLSKGKALHRIMQMYETIIQFLKSADNNRAKEFLVFLQSDSTRLKLSFLTDILGHMNELNLRLQGQGHSIFELHDCVRSFSAKLQLFQVDLTPGRFLHFRHVQQYCKDRDTSNIDEQMSEFHDFIRVLQDEFETRFADFRRCEHLLYYLQDPFSAQAQADGPWLEQIASFPTKASEAEFQMSHVDLTSSIRLQQKHQSMPIEQFWITAVPDGPIRDVAISALTLFGSTYLCESTFSTMCFIKNKHRANLSDKHLSECMRLAVSKRKPNFAALAKKLSGRASSWQPPGAQ